MNYTAGLVSVIIPTYKRSDLLRKAIDSVLGQTYANIELLVVNDNTKGDEFSLELYRLIDKYKDDRLKLIEQERHINGAAARNAGIRVAQGEYIAFQDDDDYWEPTKIECQVKSLSKLDSSYGAVACLMRLYRDGKLISATLPYRSGYILMDILDRRTSMGTGALLIRRTALDQSGYFDENLKRHQDLQLFACLTQKYKIHLDNVYLHNREIKDAQNRLGPDEIKTVKDSYFKSINTILDSLNKRQKKIVYTMHYFELANSYRNAGNFRMALKYSLSIWKSPVTLYLAFERVIKKVISTKFRYYLEKKYIIK